MRNYLVIFLVILLLGTGGISVMLTAEGQDSSRKDATQVREQKPAEPVQGMPPEGENKNNEPAEVPAMNPVRGPGMVPGRGWRTYGQPVTGPGAGYYPGMGGPGMAGPGMPGGPGPAGPGQRGQVPRSPGQEFIAKVKQLPPEEQTRWEKYQNLLRSYEQLGEIYREQKKYDEAVQLYAKCLTRLELLKLPVDGLEGYLNILREEVLKKIAHLLMEKGTSDEEIKKKVRELGRWEIPDTELASLHWKMAEQYRKDGSMECAVSEGLKAVSLLEKDLEAFQEKPESQPVKNY